MTFRWIASAPFGADDSDAHIFQIANIIILFLDKLLSVDECPLFTCRLTHDRKRTMFNDSVHVLYPPEGRNDTIRFGRELTVLFSEDRGNVLQQIPK